MPLLLTILVPSEYIEKCPLVSSIIRSSFYYSKEHHIVIVFHSLELSLASSTSRMTLLASSAVTGDSPSFSIALANSR
jgi:hypothetical protein